MTKVTHIPTVSRAQKLLVERIEEVIKRTINEVPVTKIDIVGALTFHQFNTMVGIE